jgi:excisionase family DNA binding protein
LSTQPIINTRATSALKILERRAHMKTHEELPLLLTVADVQKILRLGRSKTYEMIKSNEIPSIKLGGSIRIPRDRLLATLNG